MKVTQIEIAKLAQVSQATVSRVLSGDPKVAPLIRDRITRVMSEQNYRPDSRARSLRSRRTQLIGLVVNRAPGSLSDDPFFSGFISEIIDYLRSSQYHLCLDSATTGNSEAAVYDELLRTRRVDGLILVESEARDHRISLLQEDHFPFVLLGNPLGSTEIHSVDNDNVQAGAMATEHLLEQGYKRIGIIGARSGVTVSDDRIAGYQKAIRGHQSEHLIWHADFGLQPTLATARLLLRMENRPDAFVVIDDYMAMGVVAAARELGVKIPTELGLVGFNDSSLCGLIEGGLTSVSMNIPGLVRRACSTLIRLIETDGLPAKRSIEGCDLKVRGSSLREARFA